jgi:hypothetical protein
MSYLFQTKQLQFSDCSTSGRYCCYLYNNFAVERCTTSWDCALSAAGGAAATVIEPV